VIVFYWIGYGAAVASRFFIKYLLPFFVFMAGAVVCWILVFNAIDKKMAECSEIYQECGGVYCRQDETK
jgi:hypothetical protein